MQFSSKEPYNDDPKPYVVKGENNTWRVSGEDARFILERPHVYSPRFSVTADPRPTLNRAQTNPTNHTLLAFRAGVEADPGNDWCRTFLATLPEWDHGTVGHARRVITRLAALDPS